VRAGGGPLHSSLSSQDLIVPTRLLHRLVLITVMVNSLVDRVWKVSFHDVASAWLGKPYFEQLFNLQANVSSLVEVNQVNQVTTFNSKTGWKTINYLKLFITIDFNKGYQELLIAS